MTLTKLKGIAHDLAHSLEFQLSTGTGLFKTKTVPKSLNANVLKQKNALATYCVTFFKERLPKTFDFNKITELRLKLKKSMTTNYIKITVRVGDTQEVSYECGSMML